MKRLLLILFFASFLCLTQSCKVKKESAANPPQTNTEESAYIEANSTADVGAIVLKAIQGNTYDLERALPDAAFARILSPKETKVMTDEEIEKMMLSGLKSRMQSNIENIVKDAKQKEVDIASLKVVEVVQEPSTDPPLVPRVLSVKVANDAWRASVPVTYVEYQRQYYLFEILLSTDLFKAIE